jgi:uncharacterized membrane protein YcaP (DUF421 family)
MKKNPFYAFDWERFFIYDYPVPYLLEILLRGFIIYMVVLIALRFTGRRGIKQLSLFELILIITLGSASGDFIFYRYVPVIPVVFVFIAIISFYKFTTYLISKNDKIRSALEGEPIILIEDGRFCYENLNIEPYSKKEHYSQLRLKNVEHLGQIKQAILETSGDISLYFFPDKDIHYGLPIIPPFNRLVNDIKETGMYSCIECGNTKELEAPENCEICGYKKWVKAIRTKRIL